MTAYAIHAMQRFSPQIDYYLAMLCRGDADNAFHGLLEMDHGILPELIQAFRASPDVEVREFLVAVIWQYREGAVIPFLGEVLFDSEPRIWRQALDGLVALACPAALDALRAARSRELRREMEEFRYWLEESIEQAESRVAGLSRLTAESVSEANGTKP